MRIRALALVVGLLSIAGPVHAQSPVEPGSQAERYVDPREGVGLTAAIALALEHEPLLRAARQELEVARGLAVQAGLRPNPSVSFERREEPAGTDNLTTVGVEWPLDLFRKAGRTTVATREVTAAQREFEDRARVLAAAVRERYGAVAVAARELAVLDEVVRNVGRRRDLLAVRVEAGASPPLERDLVQVEWQRLDAARALQAGQTETAMLELKRSLGMAASAPLRIRDTLEDLVHGAAPAAMPDTDVVLAQRPDVLAAEARVAVAAARVERASQAGRFDMSVFGTYMRMDAGFPRVGLLRMVAWSGCVACFITHRPVPASHCRCGIGTRARCSPRTPSRTPARPGERQLASRPRPSSRHPGPAMPPRSTHFAPTRAPVAPSHDRT